MSTAWIVAIVSMVTAIVGVIIAVVTLLTKIFHISRWSGSVDTRLGHLEKFMENLDRKIDGINEKIVKIFSRLPADPINSQSPLRLNDLGEQIADNLEADDWAEKIAEDVYDEVKDKRKYQIQIFCFDYVKNDDHFSDGEFNIIHEVAYKHGLSEDKVRRVLAIKIRDKLIDSLGLTDDLPF